MAYLLYRASSTPITPSSTSVKGSGLTNLEIDGNFKSLNDELVNKPSLTGTGASGTWSIDISGNASTVTNGVYTSGSYANPSWITSLAGSKVTDAALVTGSYSNPSWITSLSESKVLPSQTGNGGKYLVTNGTTTSWSTVTLPAGQSAGSSTNGYLNYNGLTKADGQLYGGSSAPSSTTRLNFDGYFYATKLFGDGTSLTAGSVTNALTIGTGLSGTSYNGSAAVTIALASAYGDTQNPYASKTSNYVLAAPNGSNGTPTFRALVAADIPAIDASKITSGIIDAARLPSYVDDVLEYANLAAFPTTGETGKLYVALDTNKVYRWSGSTYIYITSGAVDSVAGRTGVVTLTNVDVGLGNVENTALSTWAGTSNVTTLGTIGTGTWNATTISTSKGGTGLTNIGTSNQVMGVNNGATGLEYKTITAGSNVTITHGANSITIASSNPGGTVTSVGLSMPAQFTVTNSPVTGSGTLTAAWASQTANYILAAPNGSAGAPTFRALVAADIPTLDAAKITTGTFDAARIPTLNQNTTGTAASIAGGSAGNIPYQSDTNTTAFVTNGSAGQVLTSNGAGAPYWATAGGASLSDDTTTDATMYVAFASSTSGSWTTAYVSSSKLTFNPNSGTLGATIFNSLSDANAKTNVQPVTNAISTVKQLSGVEFDWKDTGKKSAGVIAQQLEQILPHLVDTTNDTKTVNYNGIIAYLIESIKELNTQVEYLQNKIDAQ